MMGWRGADAALHVMRVLDATLQRQCARSNIQVAGIS
jgi:hypothetical protein